MTRLVSLSVILLVGNVSVASAQNAQMQNPANMAAIHVPFVIPPQEDNAAAINNKDWCAVYPPKAVRLSQEGNVALSFVITTQGTVTDVKVTSSSGSDALDAVSAWCVATWRFQPAKQNGNSVAAQGSAAFAYSLEPATIRWRDQAGVVTEFHPH